VRRAARRRRIGRTAGGRENERLALRADRIVSAIDGIGGLVIRPSGMRSRRWRALLERLGELRCEQGLPSLT
jgi:hypothetical protein